jgi:threonine/homoserine/homoserine lactone efflux protein
MGELILFAAIMAFGQFSPGPDMILLTRTSLAAGGRAGAWTAAGIAAGLSVHAALAVGGTAALLGRGGWLGESVRWAAAAYLAWLGFVLLRAAAKGVAVGMEIPKGFRSGRFAAWRRGLFCNLLNPKVALFLAAAAAPFLGSGRPAWWPGAIWAVIVGQGLILWIAWAWLLQAPAARRLYAWAARWIDGGFGLALWALALRVAVGL